MTVSQFNTSTEKEHFLADRCNVTFGYCPEMSSVCLSSVTCVYCGHTVGRIKMKLGMQVGLGPGHIVLDGNPSGLCTDPFNYSLCFHKYLQLITFL